METVIIKKDVLLKVVQENKTAHVKEYNEACEGYRIGVAQLLKEAQKKSKANPNYKLNLSLVYPESHESDYSTVIRMLELSTQDEVELSYQEFLKYVEDNWQWTQSFKSLSTAYHSFNN